MPLPEIMVAPNGARRMKTDHPALPLSASELADTARSCLAAGAQAIHLHVRGEDGRHSLDPGRYRDAIAAVNDAAPGMPVQITTESAGIFGVEEQAACLRELKPRYASVAVREMAQEPEIAARVYSDAAVQGTEIQHILYTPSCIELFLDWRKSGVIPDILNPVIFVLGRYHPPDHAVPDDLDAFLNAKPDDITDWTVCAFGPYEHACLLEAVRRGGKVRIGFENSISNADGVVWPDNAASVAAFRDRLAGLIPFNQ